MTLPYHALDAESGYIGAPLEEGPLPALFYFSLSAKDSLLLPPFNHPAMRLHTLPMRIFSVSMPGHENNLPPTEALNVWAEMIRAEINPLTSLMDRVQTCVDELSSQGALIAGKLALAGLSRGAFFAAHVAAACPAFRSLLGFAPLTELGHAKEFDPLQGHPLVQALSLKNLTPHLTRVALRFYMGNLDTRVRTRSCFDFIEHLSQHAAAQGLRSPTTELIIYPSVGKDGHGTPPEIFDSGADWIAKQLGVI
jgi:hypothetical protein